MSVAVKNRHIRQLLRMMRKKIEMGSKKRRRKVEPRERVHCAVCKREVTAFVPMGGTGAQVLPVRHNDQNGEVCSGRNVRVKSAEYELKINAVHGDGKEV